MKNIEVEFRFEVTDEKMAKNFLKKLTFIKRVIQKDVYFDTESGDLFKKGIFLRSRNNEHLDFKFNLDDKENRHEDCDEHSFTLPISNKDLEGLTEVCKKLCLKLPPTPNLEKFLKINRLKEFVIIDKVREKFRDDDLVFCFDNIRGFGKFIEIESVAEQDADLDELKKRMIERVSVFKPKFLSTGYIELFVKRKDFNLYKQGRYILDEDKSKA